MAEAAGIGIHLDAADTPTLFGEDQARYLIACSFDQAEALMTAAGQAGVPIQTVGKFGGTSVRYGASEAALEDLKTLYRGAFEAALG
jgi:phosphoribosylformylglycinamidine synthase